MRTTVGERLLNVALAGLSHEASGLALAVLPAAVGATALRGRSPAARAAGVTLTALALLGAVGGAAHLARLRQARRNFPPPGKLVSVGGRRIHLLAEGQTVGQSVVVWMPGAHDAGSGLEHLHRIFRSETRSILIDRPGTGWSDPGPFPRTTAREAEEVIAALEAAGERGPFVLVGHSLGGLLLANVARRRADLVGALVLLDATPPDTLVYGPYNPFLGRMRRDALWAGLARLFGLKASRAERQAERDPAFQSLKAVIDAELGPVVPERRALGERAATAFAAASIFGELSPEGLARAAWDMVVYEGDLDDLPVLLVAPSDLREFAEVSDMVGTRDNREEARMRRFYARARERYMSVSSRAERIIAPPGTGHNFPYEAPIFIAEVVRRAMTLASVRRA